MLYIITKETGAVHTRPNLQPIKLADSTFALMYGDVHKLSGGMVTITPVPRHLTVIEAEMVIYRLGNSVLVRTTAQEIEKYQVHHAAPVRDDELVVEPWEWAGDGLYSHKDHPTKLNLTTLGSDEWH